MAEAPRQKQKKREGESCSAHEVYIILCSERGGAWGEALCGLPTADLPTCRQHLPTPLIATACPTALVDTTCPAAIVGTTCRDHLPKGAYRHLLSTPLFQQHPSRPAVHATCRHHLSTPRVQHLLSTSRSGTPAEWRFPSQQPVQHIALVDPCNALSWKKPSDRAVVACPDLVMQLCGWIGREGTERKPRRPSVHYIRKG